MLHILKLIWSIHSNIQITAKDRYFFIYIEESITYNSHLINKLIIFGHIIRQCWWLINWIIMWNVGWISIIRNHLEIEYNKTTLNFPYEIYIVRIIIWLYLYIYLIRQRDILINSKFAEARLIWLLES